MTKTTEARTASLSGPSVPVYRARCLGPRSAAVPVGGSRQLSPSAGPRQVRVSMGANRPPVPRLRPIVCRAGRAGHCSSLGPATVRAGTSPLCTQLPMQDGDRGHRRVWSWGSTGLASSYTLQGRVPRPRPHARRQAACELGFVSGSGPRGQETCLT